MGEKVHASFFHQWLTDKHKEDSNFKVHFIAIEWSLCSVIEEKNVKAIKCSIVFFLCGNNEDGVSAAHGE